MEILDSTIKRFGNDNNSDSRKNKIEGRKNSQRPSIAPSIMNVRKFNIETRCFFAKKMKNKRFKNN